MKEKLKHLETLSYSFGDSSVPPPYHRSYTLHANKDSLSLTVNSYGEVLASKTYTMPENGLQQLAASIIKNKIHKSKEKIERDGCTGGTTKNISYSCEGDTASFSASAYYCGGKIYGNLAGEIDSFLVDFKAFAPDLREVIDGTRQ